MVAAVLKSGIQGEAGKQELVDKCTEESEFFLVCQVYAYYDEFGFGKVEADEVG